VTVEVTLAALAIGLVTGSLIAVARVYGGRWLGTVMLVYLTLVRSLPEILALFLFVFVVGAVLPLPAEIAAILALATISGAYQAEIIRGAVQSVGQAQLVAARSMGMTQTQAVRYIILPQAFRLALPAWSNEASGMIKASSLVYALGVPELLRQAEYVSARTFDPFPPFITAAVIYLVLTVGMNLLLRALERRVAIPT
jgi:polar amino acid transport system permease protein